MHLLPIIKKHWKALVVSVVIAELVGLVSALLSGDIRSIYLARLALPPGAPAAWVYGAVWIALYALIGFAAFSIYFSYEDVRKRRAGLWLYVVQLILLFLWPIMFFRYGSHWGGLLLIIVIDIVTVFVVWFYWHNRKIAAILEALLLIWLLFTTYLNIGVAWLN